MTYLTFLRSFLDLLFSICVSFSCSLNRVRTIGLFDVALRDFSITIEVFFSENLPLSLVLGAIRVLGLLLLAALCFTSLETWFGFLTKPPFVLLQVIFLLEFWLDVTGLCFFKHLTLDRLYYTSYRLLCLFRLLLKLCSSSMQCQSTLIHLTLPTSHMV